MKKTLSISVLALVLAASGCTTKDYSATAKSPWTYGNGGSPNPLTKATTTDASEAAAELPAGPRAQKYSWEKNPKPVASKKVIAAPDDPGRLVITEIDEDYGVFAFKCAEKLEEKKLYNVNDGKKAAKVRIVEVGTDKSIIAEVLPNQVELPRIVQGANLSYALMPEQ